MNHVTNDEWTDKIENTHVVVRRTYDIYSQKDVYELVLCDDIDSHCKFWCYRGLDNFQSLGEAILGLVKAARKGRQSAVEKQLAVEKEWANKPGQSLPSPKTKG